MTARRVLLALILLLGAEGLLIGSGAPRLEAYYAHRVVEDADGVIAPWHTGLNGQLDERVQIAVDVYKRYPWVVPPRAVLAAPDFIYNSHWSISPQGDIKIPPTTDWMCGDLSQRAWSIIKGLTAHYMYSGDPIAFVYIPRVVDYILDYAQTEDRDPWPRFPIATPTKGKAYGKCDPTARNQLDLCATTGIEVLRAWQLTGNPRYLTAVRHWGDVFAAKCSYSEPELPPWNRYTDPSVVDWSDVVTGTTSVIVEFLDRLIETGYDGRDGAIRRARDRGRVFLNREILPRWIENPTWGHTYWDWDNPMMCGMVSMCADHFMRHPDAYPSWRTDLRNMLSLIINRNGADPGSMGDAYSGAWAWPESAVCCGTSLSYNQYTAAPTLIRYGVLARDPWAREMGRRMMLMATYDSEANGVVKDGLLGQSVATGEWSNLAHPWPLCQTLEAIAWMPREFAPSRENHIVRSTSVITHVEYGAGVIRWTTADGRGAVSEVLRVAFNPTAVTAGDRPLRRVRTLDGPGYTVEALANGDCIVVVRHDGSRHVALRGPDPQREADEGKMQLRGVWRRAVEPGAVNGRLWVTTQPGAMATFRFEGSQVRLVAEAGPRGGQADAYIDGSKLPTVVEYWNPAPRNRHIVFERKGLADGAHELRIVARGAGCPLSVGAEVNVDAVRWSSAGGSTGYGAGGGPSGAQRMVFGYTGRRDIVDSKGRAWRPATEWVVRSGGGTDTVERAWWTRRRTMWIGGTADPELYRYGAHAKSFWVNLTVAPGTYDLTLKFAETAPTPWVERVNGWNRVLHTLSAEVNGRNVLKDFDVEKEAGGSFRAVDRTIRGVRPEHGMIRIDLTGSGDREAAIQALELTPSGPGRATQ